MIVDEALEALGLISNFEPEELEQYKIIIESCASPYLEYDATLPRYRGLVMYIAAKAFYNIAILRGEEISSFSSEEVSITSRGNELERASLLLKNAIEEVADLVEDKGFVFRGI